MGCLPLVLDQEGVAQSQIALIMGAGMVTMVVASIPIGALVDRIGRLAVMKLAIVCAIVALTALGMTKGSWTAAILMGLRSLAVMSFMTAQAAYVSVLVPKDRSVSAVATMGIIGSMAFAVAPAFAVWLWQHGWGREQFLWATCMLGVSGSMIFFLPKEHDLRLDHSNSRRIFMKKEWIPAVVFSVCGALQGGVNTSLAVLAFHDRGIANGATIFSAAALTSVFLRYPAGRAVETWGARKMAVPTALMQAVGCLVAAGAHSLPMVIVSGICFGSAWATLVPIVLALLFQESSAEQRGSAMGIFNFSFGLGFALGAGLATLTSLHANGYTAAITLCAIAPVVALPVLFFTRRTMKPDDTESAAVQAAGQTAIAYLPEPD